MHGILSPYLLEALATERLIRLQLSSCLPVCCGLSLLLLIGCAGIVLPSFCLPPGASATQLIIDITSLKEILKVYTNL